MDYPASKDELVKHAQEQGADDDVVSTLQQLPDANFETPADVSEAIGKME